MQTDGTFLEVTVHFASIWTPSVTCCWELLHKTWNGSKFEANNSQHFFCSMVAKAERNNIASICTLLPTRTKQLSTLLGQNSLITFKARFWQTCFGIMLYWKFRKIKPLLFKIIIILLIIIIYKSTFPCFICFRYCHHFWYHHISFLMYCMFMSYHLSITFAKWVVLNITVKFSKQVF